MSYRYDDVILFRGSCPKCGVFQEHTDNMCVEPGCLVLHHYPDLNCKCGQLLWKGNMDNSIDISKLNLTQQMSSEKM